MKYPDWLKKGDIIGCTAPSDGVKEAINIQRLDNAIINLNKLGYEYKETENVRTSENGRSSSKEERAKQFVSMWKDENISSIISAGGGDFLSEILEYIDFNEMKEDNPKWFQGYSDNTVLTFLITTLLDIACIYGSNIKDYGMRNLHKSLINSLEIMSGKELVQESYKKCELIDWSERIDPYEEYNLENKVEWKNVKNETNTSFKGRSIGGCFDVIVQLIGTKYDKVKEYIQKYRNDGIVWFFEVFEMSTPRIYNHLIQMKDCGYFENCKGVIFGRPCMVKEEYGISYVETLKTFFDEMDIPVIYDADIGHVSPQIPILSGGILEVTSSNGKGYIKNIFG